MPRWWATDGYRGKKFPNIAQPASYVSDVIGTEYAGSRRSWSLYAPAFFVFALILFAASRPNMAQTSSPSPKRDINAVLAAHDRELLAIPGVVGVYVGALNDGKTPCLKVMLAEKNHETERKIPQTLDGYPVITEVTGEIRPLDDR